MPITRPSRRPATVGVSILAVMLLVISACGTSAPSDTAGGDSSTAADSAGDSDQNGGDHSDKVATVGAGSDIFALAAYLPDSAELGGGWFDFPLPPSSTFSCEGVSAETSFVRFYAAEDPASLIQRQVSFGMIVGETEEQALETIDLLTGAGADQCDLEGADILDAQLEINSAGAYSVDRGSLVGEPWQPTIERPAGFDSVHGRRYQIRYEGGNEDLTVTAETTFLRQGALIVVMSKAGPTGDDLAAAAEPLFVDMAEQLQRDGWADPDRTGALEADERNRLDVAAEHLIAMMPTDDEVPARFDLLFIGDLRRPSDADGCMEPERDGVVAEAAGPWWQVNSGQVGEVVTQHGYVFDSPEVATAYVERVSADVSCYESDNPLVDFGIVPPGETDISIHTSTFGDTEVVEMRAGGQQTFSDLSVDVVASVFVAKNGESVSSVLYLGLLDDQADFAELAATTAERGGTLP